MSSGDANDVLREIEGRIGRPLRAMVEIADRCNEVCVHCYQEQGQKGELNTEQLKRVFDDLAEMGVLLLTLSGGEATLRSDFLELVQYARKLGFAVRVFTNGLTMTEALAKALAEQAVQTVEISLYSHRAEVHEFVTGVPGSFERTVAGIRHLVAEGVDVHVKTPVMSVNERELDAYTEFVATLGATMGLDPGTLQASEGRGSEPKSFSRSQPRRLELVRQYGEDRRAPAAMAERKTTRRLCGAGASVHIEPNGILRPCTVLNLDLGHAVQDGVAAARKTNRRYEELASLTWQDVRGCRECDLQSYCIRCHATSLSEVGDALAPYPTACEQAAIAFTATHGEEPRIVSEPEDDSRVGPYRRLSGATFRAYRVEPSAADEALARKLGWTRRPGGGDSSFERHSPGELVQIRRPGRKRARPERLPASVPDIELSPAARGQTQA